MKKKKQKPITSTSLGDGLDLKSLIHSQSEFFDLLIELIPARFYLPNDDADSKPWYQGLSKAAKASLKQQSKENLKLARRHRFDPEQEPSAVQLGEDASADLEEGGEARPEPIDVDENKEKPVTYEELKQRLRIKIELLRGNRGEKKNDDEKGNNEGKKRKRGGDSDGGGSGEGVHLDEDDDGEEIIEYGNVRLGGEEEGDNVKKKRRKLLKANELERVKRKQEVKRENPVVAERESWKAATSRAMGVKVHDDARLIKEKMKKEKRKREKNAEKWKERVGAQEKMKGERQRKRKENIVGRITEKKMRKIAKREKKLLRPGFEGRKEGFIT